MSAPVEPCGCIPEADRMLREHNTRLVTTIFGGPMRCVLTTEKVSGRTRGKPVLMLATFCPFCGVRYEPAPVQPLETRQ